MDRKTIKHILQLHVFMTKDVSKETGVSVNVLSGITSDRLNVDKISDDKINKLSDYFISLGFDYSRPNDIQRKTIYTQLSNDV